MNRQIRQWCTRLAAAGCLLSGCADEAPCTVGKGPVGSRQLPLEAVTRLAHASVAVVFVQEGPQPVLVLRGQENVLDKVRVTVQQDELQIRDRDCIRGYDTLQIYVTLPALQRIRLEGPASLICTTPLTANEVSLDMRGQGRLACRVRNSRVNADISGSGVVEVEGTTAAAEVRLGGTGHLKAFALDARACRANVPGSGNLEIKAHDFLRAFLSGTGSVYYKGRPLLDVQRTGTGRVIDSN